MMGTRRIYDEWTTESDPAHQKYIGLILRLSCGAAIPPKQRRWSKSSQSGADLLKSEQMGVSRTYTRAVISQGIGASHKFFGGSIPDLSKLQDPRTLGYLLIFGLYSKPIAHC